MSPDPLRPADAQRDVLARAALADLPKALTLQDRNPHSPTYGSFDRNHWHYRIIDFPSGMSQELVWPLALAVELDLPDNPYRKSEAASEWVLAGMRYAQQASHRDGSCDDYFPYERAGGAASFSLLGFLESYELLGLDEPDLVDFFHRRARWLAGFHEAGRLTNHQALVALIMQRMGDMLSTDEFESARTERLERILEWQHPEGWFQEYEGFDHGYQTITISLLASMHSARPDPRLREALERAVELSADVIFPDGSTGGELGSRNTANFFPHGFELVGRWMPDALEVSRRFVEGLAAGNAPCYADDHHLGHHLWNYLLAWRDWCPERPALAERPEGRSWRPGAGLLIDRGPHGELYLSTRKGGAFRWYRDGQLAMSDTGVSLRVVAPARPARNAVSHLIDDYREVIDPDVVEVSGTMGWAKHRMMTTPRLMLLRVAMATVGRVAPNLARRTLQRMLITGKKKAPFRFVRRLERTEDGWRVTDTVSGDRWREVTDAGIGAHQASIYVTMSRTFRRDQLLHAWRSLDTELAEARTGGTLRSQREI